MNVREIVGDQLRSMGCSGLYNADGECGCGLDDLMPCENSIAGLGDCRPAVEQWCPVCGETFYTDAETWQKRAIEGWPSLHSCDGEAPCGA